MVSLTEATLYDVTGRTQIARIGLNGYKSVTTSPTEIDSHQRTIWSFTIMGGDSTSLWNIWWDRKALLMRDALEEKHVRVAAFPTDEGGFGLIEFI